MHSAAAEWKNRANPIASPESWQPDRKDLVFVVVRDTPVQQNVLTLALFNPNIGVDSSGNVLTLSNDDFAALSSLARKTLTLPPTGNYGNRWILHRPTTSQPIDRLLVSTSESELKETSVQGYDDHGGVFKLTHSVDGADELPPLLQQLFGLVQRAKVDAGARNERVLKKVVALVEDE